MLVAGQDQNMAAHDFNCKSEVTEGLKGSVYAATVVKQHDVNYESEMTDGPQGIVYIFLNSD